MTAKKIEPINFLPDARPIPRFNKILLVDDDKTDLYINKTILKSLHFSKEIEQDINPLRVIEFLKGVQKLSEVPDLIFLDLNMPEMNGFEFLAEFNHLSEFVKDKCKIIVLTSSPDKADKHRALMNKNVIRYIVKPIDAYHLRDFIG